MRLSTKLMIEHITALSAKGMTMAEVATETGMNYSSVCQFGLRYGITFKRQVMSERPEGRARAQDMRQRYENGETLEQIGARYEITRERVRQILTKKYGTTARDGGKAEKGRQKRREFNKKRDARTLKKYGCVYRQYVSILKHEGQPTYAFWQQRNNAVARGIGWDLNLWQWWQIWQQSGHWPERGRGRDGYGMCRLNDVGPYSVDNVYIATSTDNMKDYWVNKRNSVPSQGESASGRKVRPQSPSLAGASFQISAEPLQSQKRDDVQRRQDAERDRNPFKHVGTS